MFLAPLSPVSASVYQLHVLNKMLQRPASKGVGGRSATTISKNDIQNEASEKASVFNRKLFGKSEFLKVLNPQKCFTYKHLGGFSTL